MKSAFLKANRYEIDATPSTQLFEAPSKTLISFHEAYYLLYVYLKQRNA